MIIMAMAYTMACIGKLGRLKNSEPTTTEGNAVEIQKCLIA